MMKIIFVMAVNADKIINYFKQDQVLFQQLYTVYKLRTSMLIRKIYLAFTNTALLSQSAINANMNNINLYGKLKYLSSTLSLGLQHHLKSNKTIDLLNKKGINSFFPIQSKTYTPIFQGKDVIAGDKTGSGKTMAFCLPVIQKLRQNNQFANKSGLKFIVLAPTRQLAVQIGTQIQSLKHSVEDFRVTTVFGGIPTFLNQKQLQKNPDILVGTPGRVIDLMQKGLLNFENVKVVCIDQADFMFDLGFRDHVDNILCNIKQSAKLKFQVLCFSATINREVAQLTRKFMNKDKLTIKLTNQTQTKAPTTISHKYVQIKGFKMIKTIQHLIKSQSNNGRVIVFSNTKIQASKISQQLNIKNVLLHGDIDQKYRLSRLNAFKEGRVKVLIASDVAARGLDIPNVQLVINIDPARNTQNYLHRSGRTGRAGKEGTCITIVQNQTKNILFQHIKKANIKLQKITISPQQYQAVQNIKQESLQLQPELTQNQKKNQEQYHQTELILFLKNYTLTKQNVKQFIQSKNIESFQVRQLHSRKTGEKFFIIKFNNKRDSLAILRSRIPVQNGDYNLHFNRKKIQKPQTR